MWWRSNRTCSLHFVGRTILKHCNTRGWIPKNEPHLKQCTFLNWKVLLKKRPTSLVGSFNFTTFFVYIYRERERDSTSFYFRKNTQKRHKKVCPVLSHQRLGPIQQIDQARVFEQNKDKWQRIPLLFLVCLSLHQQTSAHVCTMHFHLIWWNSLQLV